MKVSWQVLLPGLPVTSPRGALGWCSVCLLQVLGELILVDTGSYGDRSLLLKRLSSLNITPEDIDHIFLTHFHYDHVLNCDLFPRAFIHLSEVEQRYVVEGHYKTADDPFVPAAFYPLLQDRIHPFADEAEIFSGLKTVLLPGHTPGMAGLLIEDSGVLFAGDGVKNVREFCGVDSPPVFDSLDDARHSLYKAANIAKIIVPGHDSPFRVPFLGPQDYLTDIREEIIWAGFSARNKQRIQIPGDIELLETD